MITSPAITLNAILSLFLFAVALAVAAILRGAAGHRDRGPEPGVRRMAGAKAIVRKRPAVETLGAATVICSDKTGTLTRNEMTVRAIATAGELVDVGGSGYIPEGEFTVGGAPLDRTPHLRDAVARILQAAALANDAALTQSEGRWRVQGDPTEGALIVAARKLGIVEQELAGFRRVAEIPFTSERKRHTTIHRDPDNAGGLRVFVKGAPEILLGCCPDPHRVPPVPAGWARRWRIASRMRSPVPPIDPAPSVMTRSPGRAIVATAPGRSSRAGTTRTPPRAASRTAEASASSVTPGIGGSPAA